MSNSNLLDNIEDLMLGSPLLNGLTDDNDAVTPEPNLEDGEGKFISPIRPSGRRSNDSSLKKLKGALLAPPTAYSPVIEKCLMESSEN